MACATWPTDLGIWVHRVAKARATSVLEGESLLPHQHRFRVESPSIEPPVAAVYSPALKRWNETHSINFPSLFARCTWPHCNHVGLYCGQGDSALPHLQIGQWRDAARRREPLHVYFGNQESAAEGRVLASWMAHEKWNRSGGTSEQILFADKLQPLVRRRLTSSLFYFIAHSERGGPGRSFSKAICQPGG